MTHMETAYTSLNGLKAIGALAVNLGIQTQAYGAVNIGTPMMIFVEMLEEALKGLDDQITDLEDKASHKTIERVKAVFKPDSEVDPEDPDLVIIKPEPKKKRVRKEIDDGKIRALWTAGWTTVKIGEELGVSAQTISNHLKAMGITASERKKEEDAKE